MIKMFNQLTISSQLTFLIYIFRFDIEGDEETQTNFPSHGQTEIPPATTHSPPPEMEPKKGW